MLKMKDLHDASIDELHEKVDKLKKELMQARFQAKTGKLERQSVIRDTKRDIARVLTAVNKQKKEVKS